MQNPLDDSGMFWVNGGYFPANSFFTIPYWFNRSPGWTGFFKGATSVVVCTALLLAVRRYFRRANQQQRQQQAALPSSKTQPAANHNQTDRKRRLVVTPSVSRSSRVARHKLLASAVATVNFVDSDSETDTEVLQKPLDIEVIPVIDEVEIEADDESSELEEESLQNVFEEDTLDEGMARASPLAGITLPTRSQSEANISEFSLTFEPDSSASESSLVGNQGSSGMNARVVMDLGRNGHVPTGFVEDRIGAKKRADVGSRGWMDEVAGVGEMGIGRRVSIDDIRTSVVEGNNSDVVITQAVVSIA